MTLYDGTLILHSWWRWIVLASLIAALARSFAGWRARHGWQAADERLQRFLARSLDLQFLLGLVLYVFLSPFRAALFADYAHAVKEPNQRFFGMEHPVAMLIVVALVNFGAARARRAASDTLRFRGVFWSLMAASLLTAASIPWPGLRHGRPLFRGLASDAPAAARGVGCPAVFRSRCAPCHGVAGRGDGPAAGALVPPPQDFSSERFRGKQSSEAELAEVIRGGGFARGLSAAMPPHSDLDDEEISALVRCVQGLAAVGATDRVEKSEP